MINEGPKLECSSQMELQQAEMTWMCLLGALLIEDKSRFKNFQIFRDFKCFHFCCQ